MCLFCKIVNKEIPADVVCENENVIAIKDINPQAKVHVLILPKIHIENVGKITNENKNILGDIHLMANEVAKKLGVYKRGFRLITNCGSDAGQTVMHLHYHLIAGEKLGEKII